MGKTYSGAHSSYLAEDAIFLLHIFANDAESSDSLAVQSHVLGEGLSDGDVEAFGDEMTNGKGVFIAVSGSVALWRKWGKFR